MILLDRHEQRRKQPDIRPQKRQFGRTCCLQISILRAVSASLSLLTMRRLRSRLLKVTNLWVSCTRHYMPSAHGIIKRYWYWLPLTHNVVVVVVVALLLVLSLLRKARFIRTLMVYITKSVRACRQETPTTYSKYGSPVSSAPKQYDRLVEDSRIIHSRPWVQFPQSRQAIWTALYRNTALHRDTASLGDPHFIWREPHTLFHETSTSSTADVMWTNWGLFPNRPQ